ncbi:MAG: class I SAM-dependent methyltransferase [Acidimicrobiales bacterium]
MTDTAPEVNVKAIMDEVAEEVRRKRAEGLYPPEVLAELEVATLTAGEEGASDAALLAPALADMQRSSHFTALVTTASQKPVVAPVITGARKAMRSGLSWYINGILQQVASFASNTVRAVGLLSDRSDHLDARLVGLEGRVDGLQEWTEGVDAQRVPERLARLDAAVRDLRAKLEAGVTSVGTTAGVAAAPARPGAHSWAAETSFDYLEFENRFRGDPEHIADRQRFYLDLYRGQERPVVDIGCGRGEFLGLLSEAGIPCYGIDRHPDMIAVCREKGFEVFEGDAFEHLSSVEPGSLGGIFCAQMVEHLAMPEVPKLFELALGALALGAPLAVETINPESLFVFAHAFYVDLGHQRPLHPLTLEFLARSAGFSSVTVEYLSPPPPEFRPQPLPEAENEALAGLVASLDENFRRIDDVLFGPQDFAVIARK